MHAEFVWPGNSSSSEEEMVVKWIKCKCCKVDSYAVFLNNAINHWSNKNAEKSLYKLKFSTVIRRDLKTC